MSTIIEVKVPDIGGTKDVDVIELLVKPGDKVEVETSLITLEGDKATMEIPSPVAGVVKELKIKVGDKVSEGSVILTLETESSASEKAPASPANEVEKEKAPATEKAESAPEKTSLQEQQTEETSIHASPIVRRLAREFGINLSLITGTGEKNRIRKEDLQEFVKAGLSGAKQASGGGFALPVMPSIDFSKFGGIETKPLNKIKKLTGINLHRSWITVPHVTQFAQADITDLEAFRDQQKGAAEKQGVKLTPLVFIMKAVVAALKQYPQFNASLDATGENLILKKYFHIGVAADTPNGLVVPVIRDVDQKSLFTLAQELAKISAKAREKGLSATEMQGGCFTVSSLGGIGGTAFTPIVNTPEVAILGISKSSMQPVYQGGAFVPRLLLPLSLSYDHRVVDGAEGARFIMYLTERLSDIRTLLL